MVTLCSPTPESMPSGACTTPGPASMQPTTENTSRGARLVTGKEPDGMFHSATGEPFGGDGEFNVQFRSYNGHAREIDFINAKVSIPIVGAKRWNSQTKSRAILDEDWGLLHHTPTGEEDPRLCRSAVYFMKRLVKRRILRPDPSRDFGRRGDV